MHKDKFVFAQLTQFLDRNHFNYLIKKYEGDKYIKSYLLESTTYDDVRSAIQSRESQRFDSGYESSCWETLSSRNRKVCNSEQSQ